MIEIGRRSGVPALLASVLLTAVIACRQADPATQPPAAPTNVDATPGPGYVTVTWEHGGEGVEEFLVFRASADGASAVGSRVERVSPVSVGTVDRLSRKLVDRGIVLGASYEYSVVAVGLEGWSAPGQQSGPSVTVASGVALAGGTFNHQLYDDPLSIFGVSFFLAEEDLPAEEAQLIIAGPAGWDEDQPWESTIPRSGLEAGFALTFGGPAPATGAYTAELVSDAAIFMAGAPVDGSQLLPLPQNVTATFATATSVTAAWDPVPGALSYQVGVYSAPHAPEATLHAFRRTTATSAVIENLTLPPGEHYVAVWALAVDWTQSFRPEMPEQLNASLATSPTFTIADASE